MFLQRALRACFALMFVGGLASSSPTIIAAAWSETAQETVIGPDAAEALARTFPLALSELIQEGIAAEDAESEMVGAAEPGALIGFAGPRVIEQTIRQKLPPGFQRSEFLLEHGMLDAVVARKDLKPYIARALDFMVQAA